MKNIFYTEAWYADYITKFVLVCLYAFLCTLAWLAPNSAGQTLAYGLFILLPVFGVALFFWKDKRTRINF